MVANEIMIEDVLPRGDAYKVSMESVMKVCAALDCDISDVMELEKNGR